MLLLRINKEIVIYTTTHFSWVDPNFFNEGRFLCCVFNSRNMNYFNTAFFLTKNRVCCADPLKSTSKAGIRFT